MHDIRPFLSKLFTKPGTLLYIGARIDAHAWLDELIEAGNKVVILEVWEENAAKLKGHYDPVVLGDVRFLEYPQGADKFDYIFWWHGPEHLNQNDILSTLQKLEDRTNKILALACPWGWYPQGAHAGNPHETHLSTLYPVFFQMLGFYVETDGSPDEAGSQIVAWKEFQ